MVFIPATTSEFKEIYVKLIKKYERQTECYRMKELKILNVVIAKVWGGGEQYVYDTSKALNKNGCKVFIAVDKGNIAMRERFAEVGMVVECSLYSVAGMQSLFKLSDFIKKEQIDIINCHSGHAMLLCMLVKLITGVKLVSFKHNVIPAKYDWYHKWQRQNTDAFICVSKLVYDTQTQGLDEQIKRKFHLVYNGIDLGKFNKYNIKFTEKDRFIIGYAGRIAENKGLDILVKAFAQLSEKYPDMYLYLAGSNEKGYMNKLKVMISSYQLEQKVKFLGQVQDMERFYKSINLFVLPSVVKEAFGLVLCEAMYCGVPVITTDSGAQREIIEDGIDGFIVRAGSVEGLKEKIKICYLSYNSVGIDIERASKKVYKDFSVENSTFLLKKILSKL